ncbi:transposase, partial [Staphylococcus chromogenes]|uniref:transposase n=1 Tax=Staphylococcus chromogenes TaxID=46126 RepID=UPI0018E5A79A
MNQIETYLENKEKNLTSQIENTANTQERKTLRKQRSQIKKSKKAINDFRERKIKYENHKEIYGDRKSYSTTDFDATFMRMKDDHMKNEQLKPEYNLQIATNNQFVLAYGVYNKPGDTRTLEPFLNEMKELYGDIPEYIVADTGYSSESNYKMILDDFEKTPLITYGTVPYTHLTLPMTFRGSVLSSIGLFYNYLHLYYTHSMLPIFFTQSVYLFPSPLSTLQS